MSGYDFDQAVERRNTNCLKYDFAAERGYPDDLLPLWVADMDFKAPQPLIDALHRAVEHGIFGYSEVKSDYYQAAANWFETHFDWRPQQQWLVKTPGVVFALAMAVRALTNPGDSVLIQTPVYYPFYAVIQDNDRKVVEAPLQYQNGRYQIDFDLLEQKIKEEQVKLLLLCSPHNPIGRVWSKEELQKLGAICKKYQVLVVSDEIHCDFAFAEHPHTVFAKACPDWADHSIICTAPSKSFNIAGLQVSNIWIPDQTLREKFCKEIDRCGYSQLNSLGLVAAQAAYELGEPWLNQCKVYLRENLDFLRQFLQEKIPQIRLVEPDGTYFAWLDCSGLNFSDKQLKDWVVQDAKLWLDTGSLFGKQAGQFQRMVLACTRETLKQALQQLEAAVAKLKQA